MDGVYFMIKILLLMCVLLVSASLVIAAGPAQNRVVGGGIIDLPFDVKVAIGIHAQKADDGTVSGGVNFANLNDNTVSQAQITCLNAFDNTIWIGGVYTSATDSALIGEEFVFHVTDNGQGPSTDFDRMSDLSSIPASECNARPELPGDREIVNGNINI